MAVSYGYEVKIKGLRELEVKLGGSVLDTDETEAGLDTIQKRMLRGGKGLGAKNSTLSGERMVLSRRTTTTVGRFPRTRGTAWRKYQIYAVFKVLAPRVVASIKRKINQRWAA